jgi:hypothetical protein
LFVSSGNVVQEVDLVGKVVHEWKGIHNNLVTCIDTFENKIVSGSYDNTARI